MEACRERERERGEGGGGLSDRKDFCTRASRTANPVEAVVGQAGATERLTGLGI